MQVIFFDNTENKSEMYPRERIAIFWSVVYYTRLNETLINDYFATIRILRGKRHDPRK